jgi:hypothetical protein
MFRRMLHAVVYSAALDGGGGESAPAADAPAAITTGLDAPSVLGAATNADVTAAAQDARVADAPDPAAAPKTEDAAAPAMTAADYGELALPEGVSPDDPLVKAFVDGAAKGGMDKESVQAVISELGPKLHEQLMAPQKAWSDMNAAWVNQVKTNPEFGGPKLDAAMSTVTAGLNAVLTPQEISELNDALDVTGAGNHPGVVRALYRMSARLTEGGHVAGDAGKSVLSAAERMYPTHRAAAN